MDDNGNFNNLIIIIIIVLLLAMVMTYFLIPENRSYALFTDEVLGDKTISVYYSEDNNSSASRYLITNMVGKSGFEKIINKIDTSNSQIKTKDIVEYRYRGSSDKVTNNYVLLDGEEYRILGVFNVLNENNKLEYRIKLIKTLKYDTLSYDTNTNNFNVASINKELNNTFYNSLSEESKKLIGYSVFYTGGYDKAIITKEKMYEYERKYSNDEISYFSKDHENTNNVLANVSLIYASDYAYAALCNNSLDELSKCNNNNWLYNKKNMWLLNQNSNNSGNSGFIVNTNGDIWTSTKDMPQTYVNVKYDIYPTFYLKDDVNIVKGDGSKANPYVFE